MTQNLPPASDESLRAAILVRFTASGNTTFSHLRVGVLNGIAHLAGVLSSLENYIAAAELVEGIPGIRGVVNRIEAPGAPDPARIVNLSLMNESKNDD